MEQKSLFPRRVWKKLEANKDKVKYKFNVPFFVEREDGVVIVPTILHEITSTSQLEAYEKKVRKYYEHIKDTHPEQSRIVRVFENTLARLSDPTNSSKISKILSGQPIKNSAVFSMAYELDPSSTFVGFLSTYNRDYLGFEGKTQVLPKVKRSKSTLINLFNKNKNGFFVPEIDEKGLVVRPASRNQTFEINLVAVNSKDITEQQFEEYITAPFGDRKNESGVPFDIIANLAHAAYASIGSPEFPERVEAMLNVCMNYYPYSFKAVKKDKRQPEVVPVEEPKKPIRVPVQKIVREKEKPEEPKKPIRVPVQKIVREKEQPEEESKKSKRVPVEIIARKRDRSEEEAKKIKRDFAERRNLREELAERRRARVAVVAENVLGDKINKPATKIYKPFEIDPYRPPIEEGSAEKKSTDEVEIYKPFEIDPYRPPVEEVSAEKKPKVEIHKPFEIDPYRPPIEEGSAEKKSADEIEIGKPYGFTIEPIEPEPVEPVTEEIPKRKAPNGRFVSSPYSVSPIIDTRTGKPISESPIKVYSWEETEQEKE